MCCIHLSLESILSYICDVLQRFVKLLRNKHEACNQFSVHVSEFSALRQNCGHVTAVPPHPSHPPVSAGSGAELVQHSGTHALGVWGIVGLFRLYAASGF